MVTAQTNQENKGQCDTKINRTHTNADVMYLEDWISHVKLTKRKGTEKYLKSLNNDLKDLKEEVEENEIKEIEKKHKKYLDHKEREIESKANPICLSVLVH
jgi:hypothetical protein